MLRRDEHAVAAWTAAILLLAGAIPAAAQTPEAEPREKPPLRPPNEVPSSVVLGLLRCIVEEAGTSLSSLLQSSEPEYSVVAAQRMPTRIIAAKRMVFGPRGRLILPERGSRKSWQGPCVGWSLILVDEISSEAESALVTWHLTENREVPFDRGRAPSGGSGVRGRNGADGAPGGEGNPGFDGERAPSLLLAVRRVEGPGLTIDLRGQDGGTGGVGQTGGDGGAGSVGSPAVSGAFDCKRLPGPGGDGGDAGDGGKGGRGGNGGPGGSVVILTTGEGFSEVWSFFRPLLGGGRPGDGGEGGRPGEPGRPGPGAAPEVFCSGFGNDGSPGNHGVAGEAGDPGETGLTGDFVVRLVRPGQVWAKEEDE